nr:hypothetical protein [Parageobacillus toebii]
MEQHLNNMGMYRLGDVVNSSLERLRKQFGVIGEQLYYHAWGIDLSSAFVKVDEFSQKSIGKIIKAKLKRTLDRSSPNYCVNSPFIDNRDLMTW